MARRWYSRYIGYQFADGGILEDIFYLEGEDGEKPQTGYGMYYPETGKHEVMGFKQFHEIADMTDLPGRKRKN